MSHSDAQARRFIELRKHRRVPAPPGALLSFSSVSTPQPNGEQSEGDGTILNLSSGGCMILSDTSVQVGQPYRLIVQLPSYPTPIAVELAIVRWINANTFGFKFDAIQQDQQEQLQDFVRRIRVPSK